MPRWVRIAMVLALLAPGMARGQGYLVDLQLLGLPLEIPPTFSELEALDDAGILQLVATNLSARPVKGFLNFALVTDNGAYSGVSFRVPDPVADALTVRRVVAYAAATQLVTLEVGATAATISGWNERLPWRQGRDTDLDRALVTTNRVPEGTFEAAVWLSSEAGGGGDVLGMTVVERKVSVPRPPEPLAPVAGDEIGEDLPLFQWQPAISSYPLGRVTYVVTVKRVEAGQSPDRAMHANATWAKFSVVDATSALYPADGLALDPGRQFAWTVSALDERNRPIARDYVSETAVFARAAALDEKSGSPADPAATVRLIAPLRQRYEVVTAGRPIRFRFSMTPPATARDRSWSSVTVEIVRTWDPALDAGAWFTELSDPVRFDLEAADPGKEGETMRVPLRLRPGDKQEVEVTIPDEEGLTQGAAWRVVAERTGGERIVSDVGRLLVRPGTRRRASPPALADGGGVPPGGVPPGDVPPGGVPPGGVPPGGGAPPGNGSPASDGGTRRVLVAEGFRVTGLRGTALRGVQRVTSRVALHFSGRGAAARTIVAPRLAVSGMRGTPVVGVQRVNSQVAMRFSGRSAAGRTLVASPLRVTGSRGQPAVGVQRVTASPALHFTGRAR